MCVGINALRIPDDYLLSGPLRLRVQLRWAKSPIANRLGNGRNTVSRVLFRRRELTEFRGELGEFCEKLGEFAFAHK